MEAPMFKGILNRVLGTIGYAVTKKGAASSFSLYNSAYLARICNPKTVIDVGVGYGTYPLYGAFPNAEFILVEPVEEYKSAIDKILAKYQGRVHYKAVGHENGTIDLQVDLSSLQLSSQFKRTALTERPGHRIELRKVELAKLDTIVGTPSQIQRPLILKVDTEGNELNVLRGAEEVLKRTDFVILEASISQRFEGSYEFGDLFNFLSCRGFYLYSILTISHPAGELRPRFADVVFARRTE